MVIFLTISSDWPGRPFVLIYNGTENDIKDDASDISSDWPSRSLLRQHPRLKAGLWTCQGEGAVKSGETFCSAFLKSISIC